MAGNLKPLELCCTKPRVPGGLAKRNPLHEAHDGTGSVDEEFQAGEWGQFMYTAEPASRFRPTRANEFVPVLRLGFHDGVDSVTFSPVADAV
jgi:hypothetical protein